MVKPGNVNLSSRPVSLPDALPVMKPLATSQNLQLVREQAYHKSLVSHSLHQMNPTGLQSIFMCSLVQCTSHGQTTQILHYHSFEHLVIKIGHAKYMAQK